MDSAVDGVGDDNGAVEPDRVFDISALDDRRDEEADEAPRADPGREDTAPAEVRVGAEGGRDKVVFTGTLVLDLVAPGLVLLVELLACVDAALEVDAETGLILLDGTGVIVLGVVALAGFSMGALLFDVDGPPGEEAGLGRGGMDAAFFTPY